jgi:hypothetical protein
MSLINDALKQARQTSAPPPVRALPPRPPAEEEPDPPNVWVVMGVIVVIIFVATMLIAWLVSRHENHKMEIESAAAVEKIPAASESTKNIIVPEPEPPPPILPSLQGIFYSPTAPMAIIDGKTVGVGTQMGQYRVKEITKSTATIVGSDGKPIKLTLGN